MRRDLVFLLLSLGLHLLVWQAAARWWTAFQPPPSPLVLPVELREEPPLHEAAMSAAGPVSPAPSAARKTAPHQKSKTPVAAAPRYGSSLAARKTAAPPRAPAVRSAPPRTNSSPNPAPMRATENPSASARAVDAPAGNDAGNNAESITANMAGTGTGSNSHEAQADYLRHNFAAIRGAIERKLRYPALARRQGLSGQVLVGFVVERNGGIRDLRVLRGSGFGPLDDGALSAVRRAAPFPPASFPVRVNLPVSYHLNP